MAFEIFPIYSPHCVHFSVLHILNCFMPFVVKLQVEKITIWAESRIEIKLIFLNIFTLFSIISNSNNYICSAKIRDSFVIFKGIIGKLLQQM